jgi:DNA-binding XRE family transcriptional regulator
MQNAQTSHNVKIMWHQILYTTKSKTYNMGVTTLQNQKKNTNKGYNTMFNANYLRSLRQKKKLTMRQVGESIGVAESTICCYENGIRTPSIKTTKRLAEVYKVRWTKFFD